MAEKNSSCTNNPVISYFPSQCFSDSMLWSLEIKEEESEIFTINCNIHLGVTDVLSAVKCSSYPGLCKLQKEMLLKKGLRNTALEIV